jgi:hypothetical protein
MPDPHCILKSWFTSSSRFFSPVVLICYCSCLVDPHVGLYRCMDARLTSYRPSRKRVAQATSQRWGSFTRTWYLLQCAKRCSSVLQFPLCPCVLSTNEPWICLATVLLPLIPICVGVGLQVLQCWWRWGACTMVRCECDALEVQVR